MRDGDAWLAEERAVGDRHIPAVKRGYERHAEPFSEGQRVRGVRREMGVDQSHLGERRSLSEEPGRGGQGVQRASGPGLDTSPSPADHDGRGLGGRVRAPLAGEHRGPISRQRAGLLPNERLRADRIAEAKDADTRQWAPELDEAAAPVGIVESRENSRSWTPGDAKRFVWWKCDLKYAMMGAFSSSVARLRKSQTRECSPARPSSSACGVSCSPGRRARG